MILFNQQIDLYEEKLRPANHGPIIYFPKDLNNIETLKTTLLNKNVKIKLLTLF